MPSRGKHHRDHPSSAMSKVAWRKGSSMALAGMLSMYAWSIPLGKMMAVHLRTMVPWPLVPTRQLSIVIAAGLTLWSMFVYLRAAWPSMKQDV